MDAMDVKKIFELLPHRFPFLMVDRVLELEPGKRIKALKNVTINEPFFMGHFPGDPVMPGVLIIEALAQAGAIIALSYFDEKFVREHLVFFGGIEKARFRRVVRPGDTLILTGEVIAQKANIWKMKGVAYVEEEVAAEAVLQAAVVKRQ